MGIRGIRNQTVVTEKMITDAICNDSLKRRRNNWVMPNVFFNHFECDVLEISEAGYATEYEVKISKEDFNRDSGKSITFRSIDCEDLRKTVVKYNSVDRVTYFYFVVPYRMVSADDVPDFAGLIFYHQDGYLQKVKEAKRLRETPITDNERAKLRKKLYYRFHKICGHYKIY